MGTSNRNNLWDYDFAVDCRWNLLLLLKEAVGVRGARTDSDADD